MAPHSDEEGEPYDEVAIDTASGRRLFRARVSTREDPTANWKPIASVLVNTVLLVGAAAWGNNKLWDLQNQISEQNAIRVRELADSTLLFSRQIGELNTQMAKMTAELENLSREIREQEQ